MVMSKNNARGKDSHKVFVSSICITAISVLLSPWLWSCGSSRINGAEDVPVDHALDGAGDVEGDGEEGPEVVDSDGDTISDEQEGAFDPGGPVDTDGDTVPDYLDDDSDNDTIPDADEAGRTVAVTGPVDSDKDGIPDFRDTDSDGNTIPDSEENREDPDGDGIGNWADPDDDGDTLTDAEEMGPDPSHPFDFDGDTIPDYLDTDSDNDLISDIQEAHGDTDNDGADDRHDLDSDNDTLADSYEAGDNDYTTWPPDSDEDGYPDFRDVDSDNDGLSDSWEVHNGLDPTSADSDGDTYNDLIEIGAESDPTDPASTPRTVGNFFFIVDYLEDPVPPEEDIVFTTTIRHADIFFLMDTTGSMGSEIDQLKADLQAVVIPRVRGLIEDAWYGVGEFDDYPVDPYGAGPPDYNDRVFYLLQEITDSVTDAQAAVDALHTSYGGDCPESQVPALYAAATGEGYVPYLSPQYDCDLGGGEFGYPCFRPAAVPIIVMITDAPYHDGPDYYASYSGISPRPVEYDETVTALRQAHIKVLSIVSNGGCDTATATQHAQRLAQDTGAVDSDGNPAVFSVSGSGLGLGSQVVSAIQTLSGNIPVDVSITARDNPSDDVDTLRFIDRIIPSTEGGVEDPLRPGFFCASGLTTEDLDADTIPDSFIDIIPGTIVCFSLSVNRNDFVEPTEEPQTFKAYLDIFADQSSILDTRQVIFMVPPHIEGPGVPL